MSQGVTLSPLLTSDKEWDPRGRITAEQRRSEAGLTPSLEPVGSVQAGRWDPSMLSPSHPPRALDTAATQETLVRGPWVHVTQTVGGTDTILRHC